MIFLLNNMSKIREFVEYTNKRFTNGGSTIGVNYVKNDAFEGAITVVFNAVKFNNGDSLLALDFSDKENNRTFLFTRSIFPIEPEYYMTLMRGINSIIGSDYRIIDFGGNVCIVDWEKVSTLLLLLNTYGNNEETSMSTKTEQLERMIIAYQEENKILKEKLKSQRSVIQEWEKIARSWEDLCGRLIKETPTRSGNDDDE